MNLSRVAAVTEMNARDLSRRRVALALLVALPLAFYLSQVSNDADAMVAGGIGMGWAVSGAAFFSALAGRPVDPRLVLAGFRPSELLVGRLLFLEGFALVLVAVFSAVMIGISRPAEPLTALLAIASMGAIAVPLGLAVAALLPRELEGTMALIGIIGVEMAIQPPGPYLPLYGPLQLLYVAVGQDGSVGAALLHSLGVAAALFLVSIALLARRLPRARSR